MRSTSTRQSLARIADLAGNPLALSDLLPPACRQGAGGRDRSANVSHPWGASNGSKSHTRQPQPCSHRRERLDWPKVKVGIPVLLHAPRRKAPQVDSPTGLGYFSLLTFVVVTQLFHYCSRSVTYPMFMYVTLCKWHQTYLLQRRISLRGMG